MKKFIRDCKEIIANYTQSDTTTEDVFVVWSCKTLQNKKALLSTHAKGAPYVECTYNGDKQEMYVDVYRKEKHYVVK